MLRMAPDTSEEGVRPIRSQVTPSLVWVSSLQEPEPPFGHTAEGAPRMGVCGAQEKNPFEAPVGKSIPNLLQTQGLQSHCQACLAPRA